jgi:hypothetical protein
MELSQIIPALDTETASKEKAWQYELETIRREGAEDCSDLWNDAKSFAENVQDIFEQSIAIPYKSIQLPIFISYACLPSALSTVCPILFMQGQEGSGKSLASILMAGIFNQEILSSATTFAAIRNCTQSKRWLSPENQDGERNYATIFDNVNLGTFKNEQMYTYFLNGYNRKTDSIQISKGDGTNMTFKVFGPKICSSIHPLYCQPAMSEIARRMIVLKFARLERMSDEDIGNFDIYDRLEIESLNLMQLHLKHHALWQGENATNFCEIKKTITGRHKLYKVPRTINSAQWALCPDLICAGVIAGLWRDPKDGIDAFEQYWLWNKDYVASATGDMQKAILQYIEIDRERHEKLIPLMGPGYPHNIRCEGLKNHLDNLSKGGALESYPTPQAITAVMAQLGWVRAIDEDKVWVWTSAQ